MTYGISNYFAADAIKQVITQIKSEIDEKGNPKTKITTNQPFTFSTENYDLSDVYKNKWVNIIIIYYYLYLIYSNFY